jgi:uncharacterized protein YpmB
MKKLNKKTILIYASIILLILLVNYLGYAYGKKTFPFKDKGWQAIQLTNGDVYYGHLSTFPSLKLTDVYFIQQTQTENEEEDPGVQLVPLNDMFFGPENTMHLEKSQVLWWTDLSENSQILQTLESK